MRSNLPTIYSKKKKKVLVLHKFIVVSAINFVWTCAYSDNDIHREGRDGVDGIRSPIDSDYSIFFNGREDMVT